MGVGLLKSAWAPLLLLQRLCRKLNFGRVQSPMPAQDPHGVPVPDPKALGVILGPMGGHCNANVSPKL